MDVAPAAEKQRQQQNTWHTLTPDQVTGTLQVNTDTGLDDQSIQERRARYGTNELIEKGSKGPFAILLEQLTDPLVLILLGAAAVSFFLGETKSVVAIMAIVTLNALLGVSQEYRAERAMAALKKMAAPAVRVRRNGQLLDIPPADLVPGDVVLLEAGSVIPADGRLVEAANLRIEEASLTGESVAVEKSTRTLTGDNIPLGDRHNMVYMGTAVTYGRGTAVIVETGMSTQLGRIAELIQSVDNEKTPLQRRMAQLGRALFFIAIGIIVLASIIGLLQGGDLATVFLGAVAIAVAVVPEGLPAVVTISLALGAQRMLRRNALIRKLPAVETLGSVTVICSDKTGTLTENRMTVKVLDTAGNTHDISDITLQTKRTLTLTPDAHAHATDSEAVLMIASALANDAVLEQHTDGTLTAIGDPTEGALVIAAGHFQIWKNRLEDILPRVGEAPFSSERKRMTTFHQMHSAYSPQSTGEQIIKSILQKHNTPLIAFSKGAVDGLMEICNRVWLDGEIVPLTNEVRERIIRQNDTLAAQGLRVLGVTLKPVDTLPTGNPENAEFDLVFVGMIGMIDPPRAEVKDAVQRCLTAGIRPVMITGDHPLTALTIAKELRITQDDHILTGKDLSSMDDAALEDVVERVSVYARVSPEHKLRIVQALQKRGHIVAMTGDGVNDAPALKRSDIGVAMGITGTAVSKEASEMVILDDNFATIVQATEEGRTIYDNVRKFVKYILASNTGEVTVLFLTQLLGMPLPLNTLQILWMNLVTDGLPALALSVEKGEPNTMKRPPYAPNEGIFARGLGWYLIRVGMLIAAVTLVVALLVEAPAETTASVWGTMIFTTLTLSQMGHALAIRSERESVFKLGLFSNPAIIGAIVLTTTLQMLLIYTPFAQDFFGTVALSLEQLAFCFLLSLITFVGVEFDKWFFNRRRAQR
ncbi:MAG: cation-translocating P-type ATPase [Anaerolineae bacterium]